MHAPIEAAMYWACLYHKRSTLEEHAELLPQSSKENTYVIFSVGVGDRILLEELGSVDGVRQDVLVDIFHFLPGHCHPPWCTKKHLPRVPQLLFGIPNLAYSMWIHIEILSAESKHLVRCVAFGHACLRPGLVLHVTG